MQWMPEDAAVELALAMYIGERCVYCKQAYGSLDDLCARRVVWAGRRDDGRLACKECWDYHEGGSSGRANLVIH